MPGNVVGQAWVEIRPDLSGFSAELTAALTDAIAKAQAYVDTRPLQFRAQVDTAQAVAAVMAAGTAMQAAATANPITFDASIDMAKALAQLALLRAAAASAGGGDGGGVAPVPLPGRSDRGGQGGGSTVGAALLLGTLTKILGVGAGMTTLFGVTMPAAFSVLSLAGLGFEHIIATILGLAASLTGAIGGGLLLALGAVGVAAVGMGSDLAVMKSTIADTQTLYKALETLRQAVIQYGAGSAQAAAAQTALNVQIQMLGNTAGVAAELALAKSVQALNQYWDQATSGARVAAVGILQGFVTIAQQYIPLVAQAAQTNFTIIGNVLRAPGGLFDFLAGPGKQIFLDLEKVFATNLPTAMHAFTQGVELVLQTLDFLSQYVGGITQAVDAFLTKVNSPAGFHTWADTMRTLIGLFHTWWDFFVILGKDIVSFFKLTAGLGQSIIQDLTGMLTKLHEWLSLTTTQTSLHNLFEIHKQEVHDLLALLPGLLSALGDVYLHVAPALTTALVTVLEAISPILTAITSNAWGAWLVGLGLIVAKLGLMGPALSGLGTIFTGVLLPALGPVGLAIGGIILAVSIFHDQAAEAAQWVADHWRPLLPLMALIAAAVTPIIVAFITAKVEAVASAIASAVAWISFNVQFQALLLQEKLGAASAALATAASWVASSWATAASWLATKIAMLAGWVATTAAAVVQSIATSALWVSASNTTIGAWIVAKTTMIAGWIATTASATAQALASSAKWVASAVATGAAWAATKVAMIAGWVVTAAAAGTDALASSAKWIAAAVATAAAWLATKVAMIAGWVASAAAAALNAAGTALPWNAAAGEVTAAWATTTTAVEADMVAMEASAATAAAGAASVWSGAIAGILGMVAKLGPLGVLAPGGLQTFPRGVTWNGHTFVWPSGQPYVKGQTGDPGSGGGSAPAPSGVPTSTGGPPGPVSMGTGGFVNFPAAGDWAVLHGREYVVPEDKATPALQAMMSAAIRGGRGAFPPLTPPSLPPSLVSGGGGIHMPPVNITQGDINLHGLTPPEILPAIERAVQRNNRELVAALRAR